MKRTISIIIILIALLTLGIQNFVAQQANITIKTDKQKYRVGDTIKVEVMVSNQMLRKYMVYSLT